MRRGQDAIDPTPWATIYICRETCPEMPFSKNGLSQRHEKTLHARGSCEGLAIDLVGKMLQEPAPEKVTTDNDNTMKRWLTKNFKSQATVGQKSSDLLGVIATAPWCQNVKQTSEGRFHVAPSVSSTLLAAVRWGGGALVGK